MQEQIKHHLSDALLMAYSAGNLPEAFSLTVAAHISMCDECRARLGAFDTVGGALIDRAEATPMAAGSLEATMERINPPGIRHRGSGLPCAQVACCPSQYRITLAAI